MFLIGYSQIGLSTKGGIRNGAKRKGGESAVLDMQLLWVYQLASQLEDDLGLTTMRDFMKPG